MVLSWWGNENDYYLDGENFDAQKSVWDALRYLVPFVQFEKREKHPGRSVTVSKVTLLSHMLGKKLLLI